MGVWIETINRRQTGGKSRVTPFVGVWIETWTMRKSRLSVTSHPSWVCGLKHIRRWYYLRLQEVTPFVGVWIETFGQCQRNWGLGVTPFVGVWIETIVLPRPRSRRNRHTLRGCVDWNSCPCTSSIWVLVTPFVGVWIETLIVIRLKSIFLVTPFVGVWIETLCIRELLMPSTVTPFVGVWIETWFQKAYWEHNLSHPSWVCGLKQE